MNKSKLIECCSLTQLCAAMTHFHHEELKKQNDYRLAHFGAINTIWNIYVTFQDNQKNCEWCSKFFNQLVKLKNDLAKGSGEKLCEFCGRTVSELVTEYKLKNNEKEIFHSKYCCSKQKYIVDEKKIVFKMNIKN